MADSRAAYRYALAILSVAEETKKLDGVMKDLGFIENLSKESKEFYHFLRTPVINAEKKKRILTEILQQKVHEITMKFVLLLTAKGRLPLLPDIIQQFYQLRDKRLGILNVTTRTAVKFTPEQEIQLVNQLERATKKKIKMRYILDPSLKGGFTVQHDDTVWDASVRHQLEVLRQRFAAGVA